MGRESRSQCTRPQHLPGGRGSEKHGEGDQQEGPPACPAPLILTVPSVTSPRWLLLSASVGTPPPSLCLHFLPSALCSMGSSPLSPWPHGAQPPSKFTRESAPSGCRAHTHTPGHHHLGGWLDRRPGWLWRAILRSEASSPSGLCPSLRMWRRKEVALNARCGERGLSDHGLAMAPRL